MKKLATTALTFILVLISIIPMAGCDFFGDIFAPSDNEDIESFYIIKAADNPNYPQYSYRGDGLWTPGINIGKIYAD